MKIRIKDNSVRLRLAQNEVKRLVSEGETWSKCQFPAGELVYGIVATDKETMASTFNNGKVIVSIPRTTLANWDTDERVGFEHHSDELFILVEKDWQCLKPRPHEDESNLYVNPQA